MARADPGTTDGSGKLATNGEAEVGLSRWEQETARRQLRLAKFRLEKEKRLEHKIYFSIDFVELEKALEQAASVCRTDVSDLLPESGNATAAEVETPPSSEAESPPRRISKSLAVLKEHRLLQRLPEITTTPRKPSASFSRR
jgi:hypothetical protein